VIYVTIRLATKVISPRAAALESLQYFFSFKMTVKVNRFKNVCAKACDVISVST